MDCPLIVHEAGDPDLFLIMQSTIYDPETPEPMQAFPNGFFETSWGKNAEPKEGGIIFLLIQTEKGETWALNGVEFYEP